MTITQAPSDQAAFPAPPVAAARRPHLRPAGHAIDRRPTHLWPTRAAVVLAGGAAAAVLAMAGAPALASTTGGRDAASAVSISKILTKATSSPAFAARRMETSS